MVTAIATKENIVNIIRLDITLEVNALQNKHISFDSLNNSHKL